MTRALLIFMFITLSGCAGSEVDAPKLGYRDAEGLDPRVPVGREDPAPGVLTLADEVAAIQRRATQGSSAFANLEDETVAAILASGEAGSESWTEAQQLLSRLDAARQETALALADLDELATSAVVDEGWLSPANQAVIEAAAREIAIVDARQSALIDQLTGQLAN